MSFASIIEKFARSSQEEAPIDVHSNSDRRQAILSNARRMANVRPPVAHIHRNREAEAIYFTRQIGTMYGVEGLVFDSYSLDRLDAFIDAARESRPHALRGAFMRSMASWVGEYARHEHGLRWTDDDLLTDGRVAFDPGNAVNRRAESDASMSLTEAVRTAVTRSEILSAA
jgi:hypothetical protein